MADLTLSLLSFTEASGSPTVVKVGSPDVMSTYTSTKNASIPITALLKTFASTPPPFLGQWMSIRRGIDP
jgi:hypothetical protein